MQIEAIQQQQIAANAHRQAQQQLTQQQDAFLQQPQWPSSPSNAGISHPWAQHQSAVPGQAVGHTLPQTPSFYPEQGAGMVQVGVQQFAQPFTNLPPLPPEMMQQVSHMPLTSSPPPPPPPQQTPQAEVQPHSTQAATAEAEEATAAAATQPDAATTAAAPTAPSAPRVADACGEPMPPIQLPDGWKAKWSERRQQHYYFKTPVPGQEGKPKCYWLEQLRMVFAMEGIPMISVLASPALKALVAQSDGNNKK